ncbi:MAG: zinc-dependent metalloprotease [Gammaproteobacteria bacterium]
MIKNSLIVVATLALCSSFFAVPSGAADVPENDAGASVTTYGFIDFMWRENEGKLWLAIDEFDQPMIYQSSLARGVGSNDIGLDRGQLGSTAMVSFVRVGPKVLLMEHNVRYRAPSSNPFEQQAIDESFAQSVLWGFNVAQQEGERVWIDATEFAQRDAHGLAQSLAQQEHGTFSVDASRSAIYLPRTRAFIDNTEIEAIVTFTGKAEGNILRTVVPDPNAITVHMHHSFVRLPDDGYDALPYDPRSGFIDTDYFGGYFDYAVPIEQPTARSFTRRHRLKKKDPGASLSDPVEPIIYYIDRGAPEPVRQALIDGASWWNDAFTAAGYRNAFLVKLLPEDADPMDVRYNVIQWVHRSTRGWSYGSSVADPRTGEIIKGHVTLGSLRVRQDFLLAEGLLSPYVGQSNSDAMLDMSLARIRQLSAHEVGHTIGLEHNFAGSADDRSSVMDYPFPLIGLTDNKTVTLDDAYATGIGRWDTRAIMWGYGDYTPPEREKQLLDTYASGLRFVADRHARDVGAMHPDGNLWDNGADAIDELQHLLRVRSVALNAMAEQTIKPQRPLATIEEALVPIYLLHRYQIQAVGKLIGGARFTYAQRGDGQTPMTPVDDGAQRAALMALLGTLTPDALAMPAALANTLPPRPPGFGPTRELFTRATGDAFDLLAPAGSYVELCLDVLLNPKRAARLAQNELADSSALGWNEVADEILQSTWRSNRKNGSAGAYQRVVTSAVATRFAELAHNADASRAVRAGALDAVQNLMAEIRRNDFKTKDPNWRAHDRFVLAELERALSMSTTREPLAPLPVPPGSPIG